MLFRSYDVPRHLWHFTPGTIQQFGSKHGFIMAERHPMPFDAFYVSMLTEKHMGRSCTFLRGMVAGTLAWFSALVKKERSSSMIYVFRKKSLFPDRSPIVRGADTSGTGGGCIRKGGDTLEMGERNN